MKDSSKLHQRKRNGGSNKKTTRTRTEKFRDQYPNKEEKTNNPAWYKTNPALVEGVASLPFNIPTGHMIDLVNAEGREGTTFNVNRSPKVSLPGIAVFDVVPTFGKQTEKNSSLNVAAQAIYTWVRYYNSGARNYMPNDLMLYLIANAQIYSMINWAMRLYGCMKLYDHRNKYLARALVESMHVDYDDLLGRMAEYRGRLNLLIDKASSFVVPNTMTYFMRTASMYADVYSDGTTMKDQLYVYNPVGFYRLTFDTSEQPKHDAGYLAFHAMTDDSVPMTVDSIMEYIDDSINAIFHSHDQGVISGDLYKAYQGNILTLQSLKEDYGVQVVNDPWVLNQMKNATITSYWNYPDLYQNVESGFIAYDPRVTCLINPNGSAESVACSRFAFYGMCGDRVLTVSDNNPTTDHVMEFTRLMTGMRNRTEETTNSEGSKVLHAEMVVGTEIILRARFYEYRATSATAISSGLSVYNFWNYLRRTTSTGDLVGNSLRVCFPFFPATIDYSGDSAGNINVIGLSFNVDNYTMVDPAELENLHNVAIMNMFATEAVAKLK